MADNAAVTEVKARARIRLNAARREDASHGLRLRDELIAVSREAGFRDWDHARKVLGGDSAHGDDMGTFWHAPRCTTLFNEWFASYAPALETQASHPGSFVLPYGRQYVVARDEFIRELALDPADPSWAEIGRDLVRGYGRPPWVALARQRLRAPPDTFATPRPSLQSRLRR
ncbi:hypothetical protein [Caenimonas aquaedulcis]|uniref:Uncharacterized protein n=1 Tax=Caenimonas aquaedulcis TaxID=2793270 RepID=A0A931H512_9BURK|nr:hypothetical protein [Caenimonas aquaedulcis]MBG9388617.1 hypothetical protein [Caenimonas aquaedulcis]